MRPRPSLGVLWTLLGLAALVSADVCLPSDTISKFIVSKVEKRPLKLAFTTHNCTNTDAVDAYEICWTAAESCTFEDAHIHSLATLRNVALSFNYSKYPSFVMPGVEYSFFVRAVYNGTLRTKWQASVPPRLTVRPNTANYTVLMELKVDGAVPSRSALATLLNVDEDRVLLPSRPSSPATQLAVCVLPSTRNATALMAPLAAEHFLHAITPLSQRGSPDTPLLSLRSLDVLTSKRSLDICGQPVAPTLGVVPPASTEAPEELGSTNTTKLVNSTADDESSLFLNSTTTNATKVTGTAIPEVPVSTQEDTSASAGDDSESDHAVSGNTTKPVSTATGAAGDDIDLDGASSPATPTSPVSTTGNAGEEDDESGEGTKVPVTSTKAPVDLSGEDDEEQPGAAVPPVTPAVDGEEVDTEKPKGTALPVPPNPTPDDASDTDPTSSSVAPIKPIGDDEIPMAGEPTRDNEEVTTPVKPVSTPATTAVNEEKQHSEDITIPTMPLPTATQQPGDDIASTPTVTVQAGEGSGSGVTPPMAAASHGWGKMLFLFALFAALVYYLYRSNTVCGGVGGSTKQGFKPVPSAEPAWASSPSSSSSSALGHAPASKSASSTAGNASRPRDIETGLRDTTSTGSSLSTASRPASAPAKVVPLSSSISKPVVTSTAIGEDDWSGFDVSEDDGGAVAVSTAAITPKPVVVSVPTPVKPVVVPVSVKPVVSKPVVTSIPSVAPVSSRPAVTAIADDDDAFASAGVDDAFNSAPASVAQSAAPTKSSVASPISDAGLEEFPSEDLFKEWD